MEFAIYRTHSWQKRGIVTILNKRRTIGMRASCTMDIDTIIRYLEEEKALGATKVTLWGAATLISNHNNSVIFTTEPQI